MTSNNTLAALVTGATSGLGFEAAAQLAEQGYGRVIITGRNQERADTAKQELEQRTGRPVFETLAVDLNDPAEVRRAAEELKARGETLDLLVLNAGMVSATGPTITASGAEITFASSLIGHHQLTAALLETSLLASAARIVIAGSEAARGDVPTFNVVDLEELADNTFDGDLDAAAEALIRGTEPKNYKAGTTYATAKAFVAWWSSALARRLPEGMTVNAVSPGAAPHTSADRNMGFFMRRVMVPLTKRAPARLGLGAPTSVAAARYLEVANYPADVTGEFFASAPKKMTGPLHRMEHAHFHDVARQEAAWNAVVTVSGKDVSGANALDSNATRMTAVPGAGQTR